jgi:hypothetical protein
MNTTIFNQHEHLFTIDGIEVQFERAIIGGYLARKVSDVLDEDGEVVDYNISKDITFHETLYKNPPRDKLNKKIEELNLIIERNREIQKQEIDNYKANLVNIKREIEDVKRAYPEITKHEVLKQLVMFLNRDYEYVLYIKNVELVESSLFYRSPNFYIDTINSSTNYIYIKKGDNESHDWQYDRPIMVFRDKESAIVHIKQIFLNRLNSIINRENKQSWQFKTSQRINDMKDLLNRNEFNSCDYIKSDEKIMKMYNDKMTEYKKNYEIEKQQAIDKEIAELQKKQEELMNKK